MTFSLELLRCPLTAQTLKAVPEILLRSIQNAQQQGHLQTFEGALAEPFENGLLTADERWFFPIRHGIPALLRSEAIPVGS